MDKVVAKEIRKGKKKKKDKWTKIIVELRDYSKWRNPNSLRDPSMSPK
jgi:hypothetical protein